MRTALGSWGSPAQLELARSEEVLTSFLSAISRLRAVLHLSKLISLGRLGDTMRRFLPMVP